VIGMAKRDVIDEQMARRFAWRTVEPEDATAEEAPEPPEPPAPPPPPDDEQVSHAEIERWRRARQVAADLAKEITRAWETTARAQQAAATAALIQRAKRIGAELVTMRAHPIESMRLWRLAVRHVRRLPKRMQKGSDLFALVFLSPSLAEPEMADLLVEAAESGDSSLAAIMNGYLEREGGGRRHREIGVRLARVVAEGKTWTAREAAARWLQATDAEEAVKRYADALLAAVTKVPPPQGWRPLTQITDRDESFRQRDVGLDAAWALCALAAGYPARALGRIDRALLTRRRWCNRSAVEAAALLPAELGRPRLLEAAASVDHLYRVAERAKAIWFERFGEACPVEPLAGVLAPLLAEAPSERFLACLTVLRGSSEEARRKMTEALLAEAPSPEAPKESLSAAQREVLALLIFAARDVLYSSGPLPSTEKAWAELLLTRFGAPAFEGLAAMAERDARAGLDHEWLSALADLWHGGAIAEEHRDRLRDVACTGLRSPAWEGATAPLVMLHHVGAPAEAEDLLWPILMAPEEVNDPIGRHRWSVYWAGEALVGMRDAPGLDARLAAAAIETRESRAWTTFERIATVGCRRGVAAVREVTKQAILDFDGDPSAFGAVYRAAHALRDAGGVEDGWLLDILHRPASPSFAIAVKLVSKKPPKLAELAALNCALEEPARDGAAAAEAAEELFAGGALGAEDRRLDAILERAPARARASLAARLLVGEAPLSPVRRHLVELLSSPDEEIAEPVLWALLTSKPEGWTALLEDALPFASCPEIRTAMEEALGEPEEAETYWRNAGDDVAEGLEEDAEDEPT
jgi:hypothetical protein